MAMKLTKNERAELETMPLFGSEPAFPQRARVAERLARRGLLVAFKHEFVSVPTYTQTRKAPKALKRL